MGKPFDMFSQSIACSELDRLDDRRVESTPPIMRHPRIRDLVGQRVLEGVFNFREQLGLIQELGGLEPGETFMEGVGRIIDDRPEQRDGHVPADHRCGLEETLVLRTEAVDTRDEDRLGRRGNLLALRASRQSICTAFLDEHFRLDERSHGLFEKERIALRALDQKPLQRRQTLMAVLVGDVFLGVFSRYVLQATFTLLAAKAPLGEMPASQIHTA